LLLLAGCQLLPKTASQNTHDADPTVVTVDHSIHDQATVNETTTPPLSRPITEPTYKPFPTDTLYSLLVAELAASRQDYTLTLAHYVEQAHSTGDNDIIIRAARIAQFFKAHQDALDMGLLWLNAEPHNIEANTLVANAYMELSEPLVALNYVEKLFELVPATIFDTAGGFTETIAKFSRQTDKNTLSQLIQRYSALQAQYPQLSSILIGLSVLHQAIGDSKQAMTHAKHALAIAPEKTTAILQEITLLNENGKSDLALNKLTAQLDKNPDNQALRLYYARLLIETDIEQAYKQFTLLSEQSPRQLELKYSRAILATELQNMVEAKTLFLELLDIGYQVNAVNFYLGKIDESLQQFSSALRYYLAVKQSDSYLPSRDRAGQILLKQNKEQEAQALFAQLRQELPEQKERLYWVEASLLVSAKHDALALPLLDQAISEFPDSEGFRYQRATIYERQDKLALMERDFRHMLALNPNNANALNGLGYFLTTRTTRYEEAHQLIQRALVLQPTEASIIDSMGWVNFKLGRIDEAIEYLQKAFALYPDPEIAAHLGEALWTQGKQAEAKAIWKKNLLDNPSASILLETVTRLGVSW
jgi:tetratricopeptide (TPR) repeat protein